MTDSFTFHLKSPMTEDDWNKIWDVELEHTERIWYSTPSGRRVDFINANVLHKIRVEIEPKCDRINSLASVLPYTAHREIQELLCEIMNLCKAESIGELPPVNLPKTGRWILIDKELSRYKCSECGEVIKLYKKSEVLKLEKDETLFDYPFSHCGAKMVEPQESEG